jgi:tRNA-dihydrouridine synthase C
VEQDIAAKYVHGRLKQWLFHLQREYTDAAVLFEKVKKIKEPSLLRLALYD